MAPTYAMGLGRIVERCPLPQDGWLSLILTPGTRHFHARWLAARGRDRRDVRGSMEKLLKHEKCHSIPDLGAKRRRGFSGTCDSHARRPGVGLANADNFWRAARAAHGVG